MADYRIQEATFTDDDQGIDLITRRMLMVDVADEVDWVPAEDYFVHVDVLQGSCAPVSRRINAHMLMAGAYDPRRAFNFPKDVLEEDNPSLALLRLTAGVGDKYYELWKVKNNFSLTNFRQMIQQVAANNPCIARIVRIIDNDHDINVYP